MLSPVNLATEHTPPMSSSYPSATTTLTQQVAAYLPSSLGQRLSQGDFPQPGEPRWLAAATLFSDMSGFTRMAEELASDGPRGAEELNRVLLHVFTGMINSIHHYGGVVSHFYGDAMMVYFPDDDAQATTRALACARQMQHLMADSFSQVRTNRPPGKQDTFNLTMKMGLSYGDCLELVVGDPARQQEFVLAGQPVDEAAIAEEKGVAGQIVLHRSLARQVSLDTTSEYQLLPPIPYEERGIPTPYIRLPAEPQLLTAAATFIPSALFHRLQATHAPFWAEHRPVTSIFVQFSGIDYHAPQAGTQLQTYYHWASDIVARYGGENSRLNRLLTGDKGSLLHIFFGAPVAPDAPDQAIRCALALQRERPAFIKSQRIGLAAGKVFACSVGSESRREYTVVGDVVNTSARLMAICPEGRVLTNRSTVERVGQTVEFEALPPVAMKGKQKPVTPYLVIGEQTIISPLQTHFGPSTRPLVNRQGELDLLLGSMDNALVGVPGVVAIFGPIGVGKTRLLAEGVHHWQEAQGTGLMGDCQPHTVETPFGPWLSVWREMFGLRSDDDLSQQAEKVIRQTQTLYPEGSEDVGLWGEILNLPIPLGERLAQLTSEARQKRFFSLVWRCLQGAAALKPLLLIFEDIQWADATSLDLLSAVADHLSGSMLLAVSFRPQGNQQFTLLDKPQCLPIPLTDLPPNQARQLVYQMLGQEISMPATMEQHLGIRDREGRESAVNPLFIEEAVKVMFDTGILQVNERVQINESRLREMQVPDTIHGLLLARLDRLPTLSRDLLQIAAVIGREFDLDTLATITPEMSRDQVVQILGGLSDAELTQLIAADPELKYLFQHAMTRQVAYESLTYARRRMLHALIADWIADRYADNLKPFYPVLAYHYSQTDIHEKGLAYALAAANDARDLFANREAVELYRLAENHLLALKDATQWMTHADICLSRGEVHRLLGDFSSALADAEKARELSRQPGDPLRLAQSCNLIADLKYRQAQFDQVNELTQHVITTYAEAISPEELARAYMWAGMADMAQGKVDAALTSLSQAETISLAANTNQRLASVLDAIAYVHYSRQELPLALDTMQRSLTLVRRFSTPVRVVSSLNNIAQIQFSLGQPEAALESLDEAVYLAQDTSRNHLAVVCSNRAEIMAYVGRFEEALADFEKAVNLYADMDDQYQLLATHINWGQEYCNALHRWDEATLHFVLAQDMMEKQGEQFREEKVRLLIGVGEMAVQTDRLDEAWHCLREALLVIEEKELNWWRPHALYWSGRAHIKEGNNAAAAASLHLALQAVTDRGCPDYLPLIWLALAELTTEQAEETHCLEQCLLTANQRARYVDRLYCQQRVGEILAERRRRA